MPSTILPDIEDVIETSPGVYVYRYTDAGLQRALEERWRVSITRRGMVADIRSYYRTEAAGVIGWIEKDFDGFNGPTDYPLNIAGAVTTNMSFLSVKRQDNRVYSEYNKVFANLWRRYYAGNSLVSVNLTAASASGTGTALSTFLVVGDWLVFNSEEDKGAYKVLAVDAGTVTLDRPYTGTTGGKSTKRVMVGAYYVPYSTTATTSDARLFVELWLKSTVTQPLVSGTSKLLNPGAAVSYAAKTSNIQWLASHIDNPKGPWPRSDNYDTSTAHASLSDVSVANTHVVHADEWPAAYATSLYTPAQTPTATYTADVRSGGLNVAGRAMRVDIRTQVPIERDSTYTVRVRIKNLKGDGRFFIGTYYVGSNFSTSVGTGSGPRAKGVDYTIPANTSALPGNFYFGGTGNAGALITAAEGEREFIFTVGGGKQELVQNDLTRIPKDAMALNVGIVGNYGATMDGARFLVTAVEVTRNPINPMTFRGGATFRKKQKVTLLENFTGQTLADRMVRIGGTANSTFAYNSTLNGVEFTGYVNSTLRRNAVTTPVGNDRWPVTRTKRQYFLRVVAKSTSGTPSNDNVLYMGGRTLDAALVDMQYDTAGSHNYFLVSGETALPVSPATGKIFTGTIGPGVNPYGVNRTSVGSTINSPTLTGATGKFSGYDVGRLVSGTGIPTNTTVISVASDGSSLTMSANATTTVTSQTVLVGVGGSVGLFDPDVAAVGSPYNLPARTASFWDPMFYINYLPNAIGKTAARAATTANITLSGTQTIDGVALIVGDRVLVKNQTTGSQNGIYDVAAGAWARSTDADTSAEVLVNMFVPVTAGTVNAGTAWHVTTTGTITLGTTSITFSPAPKTLIESVEVYAIDELDENEETGEQARVIGDLRMSGNVVMDATKLVDGIDVGAAHPLAQYQLIAEKGQSGGYAPLDTGLKVPVTHLPNAIMEYQGTWNALTNTPSLANGNGNADDDIGDVYKVTVAGTRDFGAGPIVFGVGDYVILNAAKVWEKSESSDVVAGIGLERVGNTINLVPHQHVGAHAADTPIGER